MKAVGETTPQKGETSMNFGSNLNPVFHQMEYFAQMLQQCNGLSLWCFSRNQTLIDTTCTEPKSFLIFLELSKCLDFITAAPERYKTPVLMEDAIGMLWAADFLRSGPESQTDCILVHHQLQPVHPDAPLEYDGPGHQEQRDPGPAV